MARIFLFIIALVLDFPHYLKCNFMMLARFLHNYRIEGIGQCQPTHFLQNDINYDEMPRQCLP